MKTTSTSANVSDWKKFFNGKTIALATALVMVLSFGTLGAYGGDVVENETGTISTTEAAALVNVTAPYAVVEQAGQTIQGTGVLEPIGGEFIFDTWAVEGYEVTDVLINGASIGTSEGQYPVPADVMYGQVYLEVVCQPIEVVEEPAAEATETEGQEEYPEGDLVAEQEHVHIIITTPSATKPFDGTELTAGDAEIEVGEDAPDWVWDAVSTFVVTGSQTKVGFSDNTYFIDWGDIDTSGFDIIENLGTLTVVENDADWSLTAASQKKVYDGTPLEANAAEQFDAALPEGYTAEVVMEGSQTDAGTSEATISAYTIYDAEGYDVTDQIKVQLVPGTLTVTKAVLDVKTPSATKAYDGAPLTATASDWIVGFVNGETATATLTGSQTEVGTSKNTYTITWDGTANEANYNVVENLGVLTVEPAQTDVLPAPATDNGTTGGTTGATTGGATNGGGTTTATPIAGTPGVNYLSDSGTAAAAQAANQADEPVASAVDAVAEGMQNAARGVIGEDPIPLTAPATTELAEDDTPLGAFDAPMNNWVRWYVILGILATLLYGLAVLARRFGFIRSLENQENALLGAEADAAGEAAVPADAVRGV